MSKQTLHVQISGMTCVNCSNAVERVTKKLDGVEDAKVSSVSNDGTFVYEDKKISQEQIIEKVEKLGYKVHFDQERLEEARSEERRVGKEC